MNRIVRRTFRDNRWEFGVTPNNVIHGRNADSGYEFIFKFNGSFWSRQVLGSSHLTKLDICPKDLAELLDEVLRETQQARQTG